MRKLFIALLAFLFAAIFSLNAQKPYYPDTSWQRRKPAELELNSSMVDSAVRFAMQNEVKMDYDLRTANYKAYANEPGY